MEKKGSGKKIKVTAKLHGGWCNHIVSLRGIYMAINDGLLITENITSIVTHLAAITWKGCKEKRRRNYEWETELTIA
jgi:hypothetical protein